MTQIEQIRQEIERLKSQLVRGACAAGIAMETNCKEEAYNEVLAFIDSLPAETASPELEKAAEEYARASMVIADAEKYKGFIAGAEWEKQQFEKNRLAACDAQTKEEYDRETAFVEKIIREQHRTPTFSDAINFGIELVAGREKLPKLKKCSWNFEHGDIGVTREGEDILSYKGYEILLSELFDKLPKED